MSASDNSSKKLLKYFKLNSIPFSSDKKNLTFFQAFNLSMKQPLTADQTIVFIHYALNAAGPDHRIVIEDDAYQEIYRLSHGRADQIEKVVNRALQRAFETGTPVIGKAHVGDEMIDAPRKKAARKRGSTSNTILYLIIAPALTIILIGMGLILWKSHGEKLSKIIAEKAAVIISKTETTAPKPIVPDKRKKEPESAAPRKQRLTDPEPSSAPKNSDQTPDAYTDPQILDFLAAYHLEQYEPIFSEAIASEKFDTVTSTILRETGLMLIHSTSFPEVIKDRYRILDKILLNPFQRRFFLFWKPSLKVSTYKDGAKGEHIRQIQTMLKKLGLYQSRINGVVDSELTRTLIRFQRRYFLKQSGYPDATTLFFITELSN